MAQEYRHKETCVFLVNYHLIWCPKRRRKILVGPIRDRLIRIINESAPELESEVLALEVMPDHLHLFLSATRNGRRINSSGGKACSAAQEGIPGVAPDAVALDAELLL